jgi:hypothetical protein
MLYEWRKEASHAAGESRLGLACGPAMNAGPAVEGDQAGPPAETSYSALSGANILNAAYTVAGSLKRRGKCSIETRLEFTVQS